MTLPRPRGRPRGGARWRYGNGTGNEARSFRTSRSRPHSRSSPWLFGALIIKGALEFNVGWGDIGPEAGYFPFRIGILIVLASLVNLVRALLRRKTLAADSS